MSPIPFSESDVRRAPRALRALAAALCVLAAGAFSVGCGSTGGSGGGGGSSSSAAASGGLERPDIGDVKPGDPVRGEVAVTWKNLDPRNPDVVQTLVNESSEAGRQLSSGRSSSTSVRVLSDADMGTLLGELRDLGFYEHATRGVGLTNIPQVPGRRGIVVVHDNGSDWGLMLTPGSGNTPIPKTYRDCKALVFAVHQAVQGLQVEVGVTDPERVFSAPSIKMPRR